MLINVHVKVYYKKKILIKNFSIYRYAMFASKIADGWNEKIEA